MARRPLATAGWPFLLWSAFSALGADKTELPSANHDRECAARLSLIHEGLQAYRRQHEGALPRRLSDLHPQFIADAALLNCPIATASGRFTPGRRDIWTNARQETLGSYNWEFSSEVVPSAIVGGQSGIEWRRVKAALMKSPIGSKVPTVRCLLDTTRVLNLSFSGEVYVSSLYWEDAVLDKFPHPYAEPFLIMRDQRPIRDRLPPRASDLPSSVIDLSECINACLGDPWLSGHGPEILPLPAHVSTVIQSNGLPFEIRGIVQVGGAVRSNATTEGFSGRAYPFVSAPIRVDVRCARIHLLHATAFAASNGEVVGRYEVVTKSGTVSEVSLRMGVEIQHWRSDGAQSRLSAAWRGQIDGVGDCALFHWTWQNADPSDEIVSIRLHAAAESVASPFLVAMTVEPAR